MNLARFICDRGTFTDDNGALLPRASSQLRLHLPDVDAFRNDDPLNRSVTRQRLYDPAADECSAIIDGGTFIRDFRLRLVRTQRQTSFDHDFIIDSQHRTDHDSERCEDRIRRRHQASQAINVIPCQHQNGPIPTLPALQATVQPAACRAHWEQTCGRVRHRIGSHGPMSAIYNQTDLTQGACGPGWGDVDVTASTVGEAALSTSLITMECLRGAASGLLWDTLIGPIHHTFQNIADHPSPAALTELALPSLLDHLPDGIGVPGASFARLFPDLWERAREAYHAEASPLPDMVVIYRGIRADRGTAFLNRVYRHFVDTGMLGRINQAYSLFHALLNDRSQISQAMSAQVLTPLQTEVLAYRCMNRQARAEYACRFVGAALPLIMGGRTIGTAMLREIPVALGRRPIVAATEIAALEGVEGFENAEAISEQPHAPSPPIPQAPPGQGNTVRLNAPPPPANEALTQVVEIHRAPIAPCCESMPATRGPPAHRPGSSVDIYYSGNGNTVHTPVLTHYSYRRPTILEGSPIRFRQLEIPQPIPGTNPQAVRIPNAEARMAAELQPGETMTSNVTTAGSGSQSNVYYRHPPVPEGTADPFTWAQDNATNVVKIRSAQPWGEPVAVAADMLRRDLGLHGLFANLSRRALFRGHRFIRPARILSNDAAHARGVLETEVARGPSVEQIQNALDWFRSPKRTPGANPSREASARNLLSRAGLNPDSAAELDDMQERIYALEQFYRDTHNDVIAYCKRNNFTVPGNENRDGIGEAIGFDYNHGTNVHVDPSNRTFIAVDH